MIITDDNMGKRLSWDMIVALYPDAWVGLSDWMDSDDKFTGVVESVCNDSDSRYEEMQRLNGEHKKINWIYTTPYKGVV